MMTRTSLATRRVAIDYLPASAFRYLQYDAVVCLDPLLTTTTLVTAVAQGRRAFSVRSRADAVATARRLGNALLAGDGPAAVAGPRFDLGNSPSALAARADHARPLVLASGDSAELLLNAASAPAVYVACFRNLEATAEWIGSRHKRVALLASGGKGRVRCEDQMTAARLARRLLARGFAPDREDTLDVVSRWADIDLELVRLGTSAETLCAAGRQADLEFVVAHRDDLDLVCRLESCEIGLAVAAADEPVTASLLHAV